MFFTVIKSIVGKLVDDLDSGSTDYNFALAIYATSRNIGSFGTSSQLIDYINREYIHGQHGPSSRFNLNLTDLISKQLENRPKKRKGGDTAKVSL